MQAVFDIADLSKSTQIAGFKVVGEVKQLSKNRQWQFVRVVTQKGLGIAKIGPAGVDIKEQLVNEAGMQKRARKALSQVRAIPDVYFSSSVIFPDSLGNRREYPVLITEYIEEALPLSSYVREKGRLPLSEAVAILQSVAFALDAIKSAGIVHRDIKPGNILVSRGYGILTDFGNAVSVGFVEPDRHRSIGTGGYIAPEHARADKLTNSTNMWGFGAVMYFALTGTQLMHGDTIKTDKKLFISKYAYDTYIALRLKTLAPTVEKVFWKALAFAPEKRYESGMEFLERLKASVFPF